MPRRRTPSGCDSGASLMSQIAQPATESTAHRSEPGIATTHLHDRFRARTSDRFVTPQRAVDIRRTVVGRLFAARGTPARRRLRAPAPLLTRVWQHRVRGVPEQRDRSASPPLYRIAIQGSSKRASSGRVAETMARMRSSKALAPRWAMASGSRPNRRHHPALTHTSSTSALAGHTPLRPLAEATACGSAPSAGTYATPRTAHNPLRRGGPSCGCSTRRTIDPRRPPYQHVARDSVTAGELDERLTVADVESHHRTVERHRATDSLEQRTMQHRPEDDHDRLRQQRAGGGHIECRSRRPPAANLAPRGDRAVRDHRIRGRCCGGTPGRWAQAAAQPGSRGIAAHRESAREPARAGHTSGETMMKAPT